MQVQGEESFFWSAYEDMAIGHVEHRIGSLGKTDQRILWTATDDALTWLEEAEDPDVDHKLYGDVPLPDTQALAQYVFQEHLRPLAEECANPRLRRYFEQRYESDFDGGW